jgi:hypothetical protein
MVLWTCAPPRPAHPDWHRLPKAWRGAQTGGSHGRSISVGGLFIYHLQGLLLLFGFYFDSLGIVIDGDDYIVISE